MRRFKIMHLITKLELGGAQQNTLYCVANHDRGKFEVFLACGVGGILDTEAEKIRDAKIFFLPSLKHPLSPFYDLVALYQLVRLLRREKIDILHTHSSKAGILGRTAGFLARVPVVVHTFHGFGFHDRQPVMIRKFYVLLERLAAKVSDALIAVSTQNVIKGLDNNIGDAEQYSVIHSGIVLGEFLKASGDGVRRELKLKAKTPLIGMVACLKPQKAPLDFISAAAIVLRRMPEARFLIAGDGELRSQVERAIRKSRLQKKVYVLGWRRDIPQIMAALDVLALSSLWEGLPRVFPQAMACQKPIVATAVDGALEAIENGVNGFLVHPGDYKALAEKILYLLDKPDLRRKMGIVGKRKSLKEFDIRKMVRDVEAVYHEGVSLKLKNPYI